jgi:hypothetical protein
MLRDFQNETRLTRGDFHLQGIENLGQALLKLHIHHGSNHLRDGTGTGGDSSVAVGTKASWKVVFIIVIIIIIKRRSEK